MVVILEVVCMRDNITLMFATGNGSLAMGDVAFVVVSVRWSLAASTCAISSRLVWAVARGPRTLDMCS